MTDRATMRLTSRLRSAQVKGSAVSYSKQHAHTTQITSNRSDLLRVSDRLFSPHGFEGSNLDPQDPTDLAL